MFNVAKDNAMYSMCQEYGRPKSILPIMVSTSSYDLRGNGVLYRYLSYARLDPEQPPTDVDGSGRGRERARRGSDDHHRDNRIADSIPNGFFFFYFKEKKDSIALSYSLTF